MSATAREAAAGDLLGVIAVDLGTVVDLLYASVQADRETAQNMVLAAASLATKSGLLADRACRACSGGTGFRAADDWLTPLERHAVQTLETRA